MITGLNGITYYNKKICISISIIFLLTIIFLLGVETVFAEDTQYIEVNDTYTEILNMLSIDVTLKNPHLVGYIRISVNNGVEENIRFVGNNKYKWNRIGLDLGDTDITIRVYDFNNSLLETQNYLLGETGKLVADKFVEFAPQKEVYPNKIWTVKFNKIPDATTINDENVYVEDSGGNKVQVHIEQESEKITIKPYEDYKTGGVYSLYISDNITYNGSKLKTPYKQQFKIIEKL